MTYTVGSLFAGIGGFDLGFERAGFKTAWQVEIDPYCLKVLAKNFPEAERFGDIRECGKHNLKPVDVICGGFPCQDISNAGKRAGIEGERSGLWSEMHRIIRELRPRLVLVENVAALLGRGMGVVLGDLAAIGYDAEWDCISAAEIGAQHLRERIWILAHPQRVRELQPQGSIANIRGWIGNGGEEVGHARGPRLSERIMHPGVSGRAEWSLQGKASVLAGSICDPASSRLPNWAGGEVGQPSPLTEFELSGGREIERDFRGVAHGVSKRVDRLRGLGNAVVPQIPEMIARRIKQALEAA